MFIRWLDLIFPRSCILTGTPLSGNRSGRYLSAAGKQRIHWVNDPCCRTCGAPFYGEVTGSRSCPHCHGLNPIFETGRTLFTLERGGRTVIHTLKYQAGQWLAQDIQTLVQQSAPFTQQLKNSILVPVPLHPARQRKRGYNQSEILAGIFSDSLQGDNSRRASLLIRTRDTPSQTRLSREERVRNMHKAFSVAPDVQIIPEQRYVLIDDVFTTGATLNACAHALAKAGARSIHVATLAHG